MMNPRKKAAFMLLGVLVMIASAFTASAVLTTVTVRVLGPFYTTPMPFDSAAGNQVGGHVQYYLAADTCRIGQIVAITSARNVKPSATLADYNKTAGVVVGGTRTGMQASLAQADSSTVAATAGQRVIVMDVGRYWVLDSGAIAPGALVFPSLGGSLGAEGRLKAFPTAVDTFYKSIGRAIDTVLIGKSGLVQINVK